MKKKIKVKHTHRYTKEKAILYEGYATHHAYDTHDEYLYKECDDTKVILYIYDTYIEIQRIGEVHSTLTLKKNESTYNPMKSIYGTFDIEIFTHNYLKEDNYIVVEYDVENGSDDKDGYKIEVSIEEVDNEFN